MSAFNKITTTSLNFQTDALTRKDRKPKSKIIEIEFQFIPEGSSFLFNLTLSDSDHRHLSFQFTKDKDDPIVEVKSWCKDNNIDEADVEAFLSYIKVQVISAMINKAGKRSVKYIEEELEMNILMAEVDSRIAPQDQFLDFLAIAQRESQMIESKINAKFEHIRGYLKGLEHESGSPSVYKREKLINQVFQDLIENLQFKHVLTVLKAKEYILKDKHKKAPGFMIDEARNFIAQTTNYKDNV